MDVCLAGSELMGIESSPDGLGDWEYSDGTNGDIRERLIAPGCHYRIIGLDLVEQPCTPYSNAVYASPL